MAEKPVSPPPASESGTTAGGDAQTSERPLDLDVSSTAGPYPRPPKRATRKIWLAVAGAAIALGLTALFMSGEEPDLPPPPPLPQDISTSPVMTSPPDDLASPSGEALDFAPVPGQPEDGPEEAEQPAGTENPPAEPEDLAQPEDQSAETASPAESENQQAEPENQEVAENQETADPVEATRQPAAETAEISNKWVVNISSTPDAAESLRFLSALSGRDVGGRVYASEAMVEGRLQHRIRVGFFDTREEAEAVGLKIKEHFQLSATPWVVRPYKEEENQHGGGR